MLKRFAFVLMAASLVVGLALSLACTPEAPAPAPAPAPTPAPAPQPVTLKAISFLPENNARTIVYKEWLDLINQRANGALVMDYIGGPEVIAYTEQPQAIKNGVVDITFSGASAWKGLVPEARMLALSLLTWEEERAVGAEDLMRSYFARANSYWVGRADPHQDPQNFSIYLNKKVTTVDDLKGLKLGAAGTYVDAAAKALGMSITVIDAGDAYSALDTGMVDAYAYSLEGARSYSLQEVVPYALDQALYISNTVLPMNMDSWNNLPPNLQTIISDAYTDFAPTFVDAAAKGLIDAKQAFKDAGVEFIVFSPADNEKFVGLAYEAEAEKYLEELPQTAPEFLKLVKAIK